MTSEAFVFLLSKGKEAQALQVFKKMYAVNTGNAKKTYPVCYNKLLLFFIEFLKWGVFCTLQQGIGTHPTQWSRHHPKTNMRIAPDRLSPPRFTPLLIKSAPMMLGVLLYVSPNLGRIL